jgi:hypothetical protein
MADTRQHRGPHPEDVRWFAPSAVPLLRQAVEDYSWLLSHNYAPGSALKLVGDHHLLTVRQRTAVMRCSCSAQALALRTSDETLLQDLAGRTILVDGYNVLTTVEAAMAGGVLLIGRDGCMRDMASMHGSWRKVDETGKAIAAIGQTMQRAGITTAHWLFDSPVSNSGRLKSEIQRVAQENGWTWQVELVFNPDKPLSIASDPVATADSGILDLCAHWVNLARYVVREHVESAWVIDLGAA